MHQKFWLLFQLLWTCCSSDVFEFPLFEFDVEPTDTMLRGSRTVLSCATRGQANPSIRWIKDGVDIGPASQGNGSLSLGGVRRETGSYQCSATVPDIGTILSRAAKVTFAGSTQFVESPSSLTIFPGQTALFPCLVNPPSQVSWYKNGRQVVHDSRVNQLPSGSLEITDVRASDKGFYRCKVGSVWSGEGELRINLDIAASLRPSPPVFISRPTTLKVVTGSEVFLECAANGIPQPSISWLKDGVALDPPTSDRLTLTGNGSLTIASARLSDAGGYQCRAENTEDVVDSGLEVQVLLPPTFTRRPVNQRAQEKEDILVQCEVDGHPDPEIHWFKNGDKIIESEYFQFVHGHNLKILGLVSSDAGVYQCVADNPAGSVQGHAILHVLTKGGEGGGGWTTARPLSLLGGGLLKGVPGPPTNLEAVITSTRFLTLSWEAPDSTDNDITGYSVFYQEEGSERERVVNSTRGTLEEISIQGLQPGSLYSVRVLAHNEYGPGVSSPPLSIRTQSEVDLPAPPTEVTATPVSAFSILISWQPPPGQTNINKYKLYFRRGEFASVEEERDVTETMYHLSDLREFTEYTFWVSAFNSNGEGGYSEEVTSRTYSDIPADPPSNVTLEPASSSSIIVRWEPPPRESQNGILTGYKIKWRRAGSKNTQTKSTDGSRRLYAIPGLRNGREYQVKMSALTVNGTGPYTPWISAATFASDLDETVVPDPPAVLRAKASDDSITIVWNPPKSNTILVRGYTIGWGKGIPDEYTNVVDNKQRYFVIENLKPNSEYVISLRAYNNQGDGRPIYETTRTQNEAAREPSTPLHPPLGLHAIVLSSTTVVLTWMDSTLPRNQLITDNRYYIVRYTSVISIQADRPKHSFRNATDLNAMIDDLRPNTEYEFTVKVVKGQRQSPWSLVVLNTTQEAAPASAPRDLNIIGNNGDAASITLTWLPPRRTNGRINGYVIFYTEDKRRQDREWVVEGVVGDKTSAEIRQLNPDTKYFFKIQARNSKGYGPHSQVVSYRTRNGLLAGGGSGQTRVAGDAGISPTVQYAIFATGGVIVIVAVVFGLVMCRRGAAGGGNGGNGPPSDERNKPYMKGESGALREKLNPPPPDLWINHDQLELKSMDSNQEEGGRASSIPRSTPVDPRGSQSTLDRSRYIAPYSGTESERSYSGRESQRRLLRQSLAAGSGGGGSIAAASIKPMKIAAIGNKPKISRYLSKDSVASSIPAGGSCSGSTYIRSQYNLNPPPASNRSLDSPHSPEPLPYSDGPPSTCNGDFNWANTTTSSIDGGSAMSCCHTVQPPQYMSSAMSTSSADSGSASGSGSRAYSGSGGSAAGSGGGGSRRPSHLRSFHAAPSGLSQPKAVFVRPTPTSPFKRALSSTLEEPGNCGLPPASLDQANCGLPASMEQVRSPDILHPQGPCDCLNQSMLPSQHSHSTEELNNEMRNLESVMKDLNAIAGKPAGAPHPLHIPCTNQC